VKFEWTAGRRRVALIGGWILATLLIVVCARTIDWTRATDVLATTRPSWIVVAVLFNAAIIPVTAAFWMSLRPTGEPPVPFRRAFEIAATSIALMNTMPFGAGHAASVVLWMRRGDTTQRGALSILALDQLGEGIAKISLFLLVAALAPMPSWMRAGVTTATLLVAALAIALAIASRWATELRIDRSWSRSSMALTTLAVAKLFEVLAIVAVQRALGVDVSLSGSLLVFAATMLGSMLPATPGNAGTYEAAVFVAYRHLGVSAEHALALAIVQHVCFLLPSVGVGYLFVSAQTLARNAIASR
jgi:uncharacterized membrane protein YbhN (UPF0104 family)